MCPYHVLSFFHVFQRVLTFSHFWVYQFMIIYVFKKGINSNQIYCHVCNWKSMPGYQHIYMEYEWIWCTTIFESIYISLSILPKYHPTIQKNDQIKKDSIESSKVALTKAPHVPIARISNDDLGLHLQNGIACLCNKNKLFTGLRLQEKALPSNHGDRIPCGWRHLCSHPSVLASTVESTISRGSSSNIDQNNGFLGILAGAILPRFAKVSHGATRVGPNHGTFQRQRIHSSHAITLWSPGNLKFLRIFPWHRPAWKSWVAKLSNVSSINWLQ